MKLEEFIEKFNDGMDYGYPEDLINLIYELEIPKELKLVKECKIYRGIYFEELNDVLDNFNEDFSLFNHLNKNPTSWTTNFDVALNFAQTGKHGIIIYADVSQVNILLNLNLVTQDLKYKNEYEVIVDKNVGKCLVIYKNNIP